MTDAMSLFEILMYINIYYYLMSGTCNIVIAFAKYSSIIDTPKIQLDASIQGVILIAETSKLILFHKLDERRKVLATVLSLVLTAVSIGCLYYVFVLQKPILKLEIILDIMFSVLLCGEVVFGSVALLSFCRKDNYYTYMQR